MKKKNLLIAALLAIIVCFSVLVISSFSSGYYLHGSVSSMNPNYRITAELKTDGETKYTCIIPSSQGNGNISQNYEFPNVEIGTYDLVISKPGHLCATVKNIVVNGSLTLSKNDITLKAGDINGDEYIDATDVSLFVSDLGKSKSDAPMDTTDINGDGFRDGLDVTILAFNLLSAPTVQDYIMVTPDVPAVTEPERYNKLVISDFEQVEPWLGTDLKMGNTTEAKEGSGYVESVKNSDIVIYQVFKDPMDISAYADEGSIHLSVYVDKISHITGGQIELSSSGTADKDEIHWGELGREIALSPGWNELDLKFSKGITEWGNQTGYPNFKKINYFRIYLNVSGGNTVLGVDDLYLYSDTPYITQTYTMQLASFDDLSDWRGYETLLAGNASDSPTETGYAKVDSQKDATLYTAYNNKSFDISMYREIGYLHLWLYVSDASKIYGGQIELTSSGTADSLEYHFGALGSDIPLKTGWNELDLPLSSLKAQNGNADFENINYFRIYVNASSKIVMAADDMYVYATTNKPLVTVTLSNGESSVERKRFEGDTIDLSKIAEQLKCEGHDIAGWTDGVNTFGANESYKVTREVNSLTAVRDYWDVLPVIYSDGMGNTVEGESNYVSGSVKLGVCEFDREGYTFGGWKDNSGRVYKSGQKYFINSENNILTAVWERVLDYELLSDAQEAWELRDGGPADVALSAIGKSDAQLKWTVWLNSKTFGQVLDFSTEGSAFRATDTSVDLSGDFAISAWIKAPLREDNERTVISSYDWKLTLRDEILSFEADGVSGLEAARVDLIDGRWHHILVSREEDTVTYYVDGSTVKSVNVSGAVGDSSDIYIGANSNYQNGFDGSISQIRIFGAAKTPSEVTSTIIDESDNVRKKPVFNLKHGITTDRSQGFGTVGGKFTAGDVQACKDMGFEFVRMMIYVDNLVGEGGKLNEEYINWSKKFINTIIDNGLGCMISLGCGDRSKWNGKYLGTRDGLEELVIFFGELTEWINEQGWDENEVCLLLYTEPVNASGGAMNWTWISDRLCAAVRNVDPDMTIVTSSEEYGNFEKIKEMSPVTDDNVVYSFTSYEPYTIGFNSFNGDEWWKYVKDIPYPIEAGVDYTQAIEKAIENVPAQYKSTARGVLSDYVSGKRDAWRANPYPGTLYNADWHMTRVRSLYDWSESYGGDIHFFVAEFGGCDKYSNERLGAYAGSGISEETRLQLIEDSRIAYDAYGIYWSFWEYNESFGVYDPVKRQPGVCVTAETFPIFVYKDMLDALGLDYNKDIIK